MPRSIRYSTGMPAEARSAGRPRTCVGRDLLLVAGSLSLSNTHSAQLAGAPVRLGLDRVVDRRVDVLAHQLHRHVAAALEGDGTSSCRRRLQHDGDDLVFLLGAGAAHLELVGRLHSDGVEKLLGGLVGRLLVHPQHELVQRHHRHRRQVAPVERHAGRASGVVNRFDSVMILCGFGIRALDVEEALGACAAALVDDDDGLLR